MLAGGCPLMDSLLITFGRPATGGFGIKNDSMCSYSTYIQVVTTVSMILFGVNFSAYFYLIRGKFRKVLIEEVRWYFGVILAAIALISWNIRGCSPACCRPSSRRPSRWGPSSPPPATPPATLTSGPPLPRASWCC